MSFARALRWSAVTHLILFVLGWLYTQDIFATKPPVIITAKLVRRGKKPDPKLMPRKPPAQSAPVKPVPVQPKRAPKPDKPVAPVKSVKKIKKVKTKQQKKRPENRSAKRLQQQKQETQGEPDGVLDGELGALRQRLLTTRYASRIAQCLRANYTIAGVDPKRVQDCRVEVALRIAPDGKFMSYTLSQPACGVLAFKQAVTAAVRGCGQVKPPSALRQTVRRDGVTVVFKP